MRSLQLAVAAGLLLASGVAGAQVTAGLVPCRGQRIDSITVDAQAPAVSGVQRVPVIGGFLRGIHRTTRGEVVLGYLLLRVGDRCDELRRSESERILRAQPFIADATIEVLRNDRGGVDLEVRTTDEFSEVLGGSLSAEAPSVRAAKGGSGNVSGLGIAATAAWRHRPAYDDRVELRLVDHLLAGRPHVLSMVIVRDQYERDDRLELTLPFRTDVQRFAWRTLLGESRNHAGFEQRDSGQLLLGFAREHAEAGGIIRIGPPGQLTLLGLSFTSERTYTDTVARLASPTGFRPDTAAEFAGHFGESRSARINALLGLRGLRFMRVRGFDALRGTQDVPIGIQLGMLMGRSVKAFGATAEDVFMASDAYVGVGVPSLTYQLRVQAEGRRPRGSDKWDGLVGSARLTRHSKPSPTRTRILTVSWGGTLRSHVPHALSLGLTEGGMRGFRGASDIGGRRAIFRFDEQAYLGSPFDYGDFGFGVFSDVGKLWPGDIAYATSRQPVRISVGTSLLLAVPVRSTQMWRLEFAVPVNREPDGDRWQVRLARRDVAVFFRREAPDVSAARARAVPASIYNWP